MKKIIKWIKNFLFYIDYYYFSNYLYDGKNMPQDGSDQERERDTVAVRPKPIEEFSDKEGKDYSNIFVILDAGHGPKTAGKKSPKFKNGSRFYEYSFNIETVYIIAKMLDKWGIKYAITNTYLNDLECYGNCLEEREDIINNKIKVPKNNFVIVISQHANAFGKKWNNIGGSEVWIYNGRGKKQELREEIATIFLDNYIKYLGLRNRGIKKKTRGQFYLLRKVKYFTIFLEPAFFTNPKEVKFLMSNSGRYLIAKACVNSIRQLSNQIIK